MTKITNLLDTTKSEIRKWNAMTMYVQERAFVNWCNLVLRKKGFQIKNIIDLEDGVCLLLILKTISSQNFEIDIASTRDDAERNWRIILKYLEEENIHVPESPDSVCDITRRTQIITFIVWRIILRFQICGDIPSETKLDNNDYVSAPRRLMKWLKYMIPNDTVSNFTSDWSNGIALCHLLNAIRPGTISEDMLAHKDNNEINVRLACTTAEDELGIPELIVPYEIANGMCDEKSMMIYLDLFRSADKMLNKTKYTERNYATIGKREDVILDSVDYEDKQIEVPPHNHKVVAFGAGLRWGQVGKPSEFFVQVGGPEFSELSISIECRPFDNRITHYKPGLQIKAIDKKSYLVRYTPTRPGEYILNVFYCGRHITDSPFRLNVHETVLKQHYKDDEIMISFNPAKVTYTESHLLDSMESVSSNQNKGSVLPNKDDSAFGDDDDLSSLAGSSSKSWKSSMNNLPSTCAESESLLVDAMRAESNKVQIYGTGLRSGEVGLVSSFHVRTPNSQKGPLSVSITCPALSIPVPSVKTYLHGTYMMHDVVYLPTEPGIYQVDVKWGENPLEGSPFYLSVAETKEDIVKQNEVVTVQAKDVREARISYYRPLDKHNVIIYHSATTADTNERVNKHHLESLLHEENPLDSLICITMDLELERLGRKKIFEKASSKKLPMVFVNDQYVGSYDDIVSLYNKGALKECLLEYKTTS